MVGAVGGLLLLAGNLALYEHVPEEEARAAGVALGLLTLLIGLVLSVVHRSRALDAAGVALTAGAVLPLAFLVANDPDAVDSRADVLVAAVLAVLVWSALFVVGPTRGHGVYLGLALLVLWLGAVSQTSPERFFFSFWPVGEARAVEGELRVEPPPDVRPFPPSTFDRMPPRTFETVPPPTFRFRPPPPDIRPFPSAPPSPSSTTTTTAAAEQSLGEARLVAQFEEDGLEEPQPPVAPGVVSLVFAALYLAAAGALDRARLRRVASAVLTVGVAASFAGVVLCGPRLGAVGAASLGLVYSVVVVVLGVGARRRLVAWLGAGSAAFALASAVEAVFEDPGAGAAVSLLLLGAAAVALGVVGSDPDEAPA